MGKSIAEILAENGIDPAEASKAIRALNRDKAEERANLLEQKKESNFTDLCDTANSFRAELETAFGEFLPGTHANFTVRVTDKGVIATANDCHSTGKVESIHVTSEGETVFGQAGAEAAKNVRARKKN